MTKRVRQHTGRATAKWTPSTVPDPNPERYQEVHAQPRLELFTPEITINQNDNPEKDKSSGRIDQPVISVTPQFVPVTAQQLSAIPQSTSVPALGPATSIPSFQTVGDNLTTYIKVPSRTGYTNPVATVSGGGGATLYDKTHDVDYRYDASSLANKIDRAANLTHRAARYAGLAETGIDVAGYIASNVEDLSDAAAIAAAVGKYIEEIPQAYVDAAVDIASDLVAGNALGIGKTLINTITPMPSMVAIANRTAKELGYGRAPDSIKGSTDITIDKETGTLSAIDGTWTYNPSTDKWGLQPNVGNVHLYFDPNDHKYKSDVEFIDTPLVSETQYDAGVEQAVKSFTNSVSMGPQIPGFNTFDMIDRASSNIQSFKDWLGLP